MADDELIQEVFGDDLKWEVVRLPTRIDEIEMFKCMCGGRTCEYCGHVTHNAHSTLPPLGTGTFGKSEHCAKCGYRLPPG